jgi:hypothetical protein
MPRAAAGHGVWDTIIGVKGRVALDRQRRWFAPY